MRWPCSFRSARAAHWGWSSAATLGLFAAGVVLLLAWGWWELHVRDPLIDLRPFANVRFLFPNLAGFAVGMSIGAVFLLFVGYAEIPPAVTGYGFGASALHAGSFLLPGAVCVLIAGPLMGILAHRRGPRPVLITGAVLVALTFLLLAPAHDRQWEIYVGSAVFGTAVACSLTGMYSLVAEAVGPDQAGMAQGVNSLVYALGSATGSSRIRSRSDPRRNAENQVSNGRGLRVSCEREARDRSEQRCCALPPKSQGEAAGRRVSAQGQARLPPPARTRPVRRGSSGRGGPGGAAPMTISASSGPPG